MSATVTELPSYLIINFFDDFVSATRHDFDDALALYTGLWRVSGRVMWRVTSMRVGA